MSSNLDQLDLRYLSHQAFSPSEDVEIYYEDNGTGPCLTLINNFYIVSPVWRTFTADIAEHYRLITYDLRNQGASSSSGLTSFDDHVEDLRSLLDHRGIQQTYLLGTSISTLIAREFAARYPERVLGLILVGPAFSPNGSLRRKLTTRSWLNSLENGGTNGLFDHIYPLVFPDQTVHEIGNAGYLALRENFLALLSRSSIRENLVASLEVTDSPEQLKSITAPTLIINGDGDFAWSRSVIEDALAIIPNSQEVTLPRAGHVPYFDDPNGFQEAVHNFVTKNELTRHESGN